MWASNSTSGKNIFKEKLNADRMEISVPADGYAIDVERGALSDVFPDVAEGMPDEIAAAPVASGCPVSGTAFHAFLTAHADTFDIPNNYPAPAL